MPQAHIYNEICACGSFLYNIVERTFLTGIPADCSVLRTPTFLPIFAYRGTIVPLLCSYWGGAKGLSPTYEQAHVGERPFDPGILHINFVHQFQLHIVADTQTVDDNTGCAEFLHEIYQFVILIKHILMMSFVALIHFKTVRECRNGNHTLAFFLILNPVCQINKRM